MNFLFIADILFPVKCVSCGDPVLSGDMGICPECCSNLPYISDGCARCNGIIHDGICTICSDRKFYPERNIMLFEYKGAAMKMVHAFKFKGLKCVSGAIIPPSCEKLAEISGEFDIITSVPMAGKKVKARGYNQSAIIAEGMAKNLGKLYQPILRERENSLVQRDLNYTERFINVIDRYEIIENNRIIDKKILIVDDVFTTGATLNECSRCVLAGGASKVFTFAVARSDLRRPDSI